ncbi:MAG: alpha-amylase family glycosyl hydrolase [Tessaracoccus sp.]
MSTRELPASTYRLQLHAGFTFDDAAAQVGRLADLGITHLFCSPILQATPGSMHGYDVVDHSRLSDDLGGIEGFRRLAEAAHSEGWASSSTWCPITWPCPRRCSTTMRSGRC